MNNVMKHDKKNLEQSRKYVWIVINLAESVFNRGYENILKTNYPFY